VSATRGRRAAWIVLGLLTATQIGIGAWRAILMFRGGLAAGVRPLAWSAGLGADLLLCGLLAVVSWWWLPSRAPRDAPRWGEWGIRFLVVTWIVALSHYVWGLAAAGPLWPPLTWIVLALLFGAGTWIRRSTAPRDISASDPAPLPPPARGTRLAFGIAAAFFVAQLPHLVFTYSFTDAKTIWACRGFKLAEHGSLTGIMDCLDPARPPLHAVLLWLGMGDPTFEGRLLPLLMFGAFVLVVYQLLRRVAPRLAPWGIVWLLVTDHVFKGQVSSYTGVPEMLAIVVGLAVLIDERALASTRRFAMLIAVVAAAAVSLTRRDGFPEFLVTVGVLMLVTRRWRDPIPWVLVAAACAAYLSWMVRPEELQFGPAFPPSLSSTAGVLLQAEGDTPSFVGRLWMLLYGAQGQVLSHYGYGVFTWGWIILTVWARRSLGAPDPGRAPATLYGIAGISGWLATLGAYAALTLLGHPYMTSLFVLRTGFGRHLVHFFPLCLLHATAIAERLVGRVDAGR
jgi:hypothetical protein